MGRLAARADEGLERINARNKKPGRSRRSAPVFLYCSAPAHRPHVFEKPRAVVVKIKHSARHQIEPVAAGGIVKVAHGLLDLCLHGGALRFEIKRPVLKHEVLPGGHIHELHLRRDRSGRHWGLRRRPS